MLYKVFDFADKEVHEVMVPRPQVVAISARPAAGGGARGAPRVAVHALSGLPRLARRDPRHPARARPLLARCTSAGSRSVEIERAPAARLHRPGDEGPRRAARRVPQAEPAHGGRRRRVRQRCRASSRSRTCSRRSSARSRTSSTCPTSRSSASTSTTSASTAPSRSTTSTSSSAPRSRSRTTTRWPGFVFGLLGRAPEVGDEVTTRRDSSLRVVEVEGSRIQRLEVEFERRDGDGTAAASRGVARAADRAPRQDHLRRPQLPRPCRGAGRRRCRSGRSSSPSGRPR